MGSGGKYEIKSCLKESLFFKLKQNKTKTKNRSSLMVQWLRIHLPNAGDVSLTPGLGIFYMLQGN